MSSTTATPSSFLSSPRGQRMLMWVSAAILVVGIAVFLGVEFGGGTSQDVHAPSPNVPPRTGGPSHPVNPVAVKNVPASPAARRVARTFLETAVARKNLATGWTVTGPFLKGESRAQWLTGTNPVSYFPAGNFKTAPFKVDSSTKGDLLLDVGPLVAAKGAKIGGQRSLVFQLEVEKIGGKWLVNYFAPVYRPAILADPGDSFSGN